MNKQKIAIISNKAIAGFGGLNKASQDLYEQLIAYYPSLILHEIPLGKINFINDVLKALFKKQEILILMHFKAILFGAILNLFHKCKTINVIHTDIVGYYQRVNVLKKAIIRIMILLIRNKPIVFVSHEAEEKAKFFFKLKNTDAIYNIISLTDENIVAPKKKGTPPFILGSVSRLHKTKHIDQLMFIFDLLMAQVPNLNVQLHIYGDGQEYSNLLEYKNRLHSREKIFFLGYQEDQKQIYSSIDALISFSSLEGFGLTILEALQYNKPVFHTSCPCGPTEILAKNNDDILRKKNGFIYTKYGYLTPPPDYSITYPDKLTPQLERYIKPLYVFISTYKTKTPDKYDFSRFLPESITQKWLSLIRATK